MGATAPTDPTVSGYWVQSRGPLASLLFVTPLLAVYEVGVLGLGPQAVRNGADVWLRQLLQGIGLGQYFLLPLLTVCLLLGWHHTTRSPWRVSQGVLWGMAGECLVLALCLRLLLHIQGTLLGGWHPGTNPAMMDLAGAYRRAIGFLGAGVYEELLFRLILLAPAVAILRRLGAGATTSTVAAVAGTSLVFAAAHHVGPHGEPVAWTQFAFWFTFSFRVLAGVFFSLLFVYRGFGITAGTHAGYDILVGIVRF